MQDKTVQRILGDPNFNPDYILEDALIEYIKGHPTKVAECREALRWLVRDPSTISDISKVVDINDIEMIGEFMETVKRSSSWSRADVIQRLLKNTSKVRPENMEEFLKLFNSAMLEVRPSIIPAHFRSHLSRAQLKEVMISRLQSNLSEFRSVDWNILIKYPEGVDAFLQYIKGNSYYAGNEATRLQIFSDVARIVKGKPVETILLDYEKNLQGYRCFACSAHLKSLSGYTQHRAKKCTTHPSPHEIILGHPKSLSFVCKCGDIFTTKSALTLHRKVCSA